MTSASSFKWFKELEERASKQEERIRQLENPQHNILEIERTTRENESRIRQLEKHIHYPHNETAMKEAAARAQAHLLAQVDKPRTQAQRPYMYGIPGTDSWSSKPPTEAVPMRSDVEAILTMTAFIKRLLSPEDFAYAVTLEVRNEARRALAIKEREV